MKLFFSILFLVCFLGCIASSPNTNKSQTSLSLKNDYPGYNFSSLVALNVPLECDISYIYQGQSYLGKVYMKGSSDMRVEIVLGSSLSQCAKTISIVSGNKIYVGCENKTILPSCVWFSSEYNPLRPGKSSTFDFTETRSSEISCKNWVFDLEKFSTPGAICNLGN